MRISPLCTDSGARGTKRVFDLKDGDEAGVFFNLVQHHGYPTPLLDSMFPGLDAACEELNKRNFGI